MSELPSMSRAQWILLVCGFLQVFTETLLSPFYPQFFAKVFGVGDLEFTGRFIAICRLTVMICGPLWGLLARRYSATVLLMVGQFFTAVLTALCALAQDERQFIVLTVFLLIFKSSYMLVYSLLMELAGGAGRAAAIGKLQAAVHLAIIASSLCGAWVIDMPSPLWIFYPAALLDIVLLVLCLYALRMKRMVRQAPAETAQAAPSVSWPWMAALGLCFICFHLGINVIRPYFTQYVSSGEGYGLSTTLAGVLFLVPSAMALVAMPWVRRLHAPGRHRAFYTGSVSLLVMGLMLQAVGSGWALLLAGRVLFGFCVIIAQSILELRLFSAGSEGRLHLRVGLSVAWQNAALLGAPLLASELVSRTSLVAPFWAAGAAFGVSLILASIVVFQGRKDPVAIPVLQGAVK